MLVAADPRTGEAANKKQTYNALILILFSTSSRRLGDGLNFDLETELARLSDEAVGFELGRAVVKMTGPEILMFCPVFQHVVNRGQHRGGDGADGRLRATLQSMELGFVVAV